MEEEEKGKGKTDTERFFNTHIDSNGKGGGGSTVFFLSIPYRFSPFPCIFFAHWVEYE